MLIILFFRDDEIKIPTRWRSFKLTQLFKKLIYLF